MRRMFAALTVAAFVVALGAPALAKEATVKARRGSACYTQTVQQRGADQDAKRRHKGCALGCAKAGRPMALLTSDGKVYVLTGGLAAEKNAKIIPHVAHTVEVTGEVTEADGKMTIAADSLKMISK